MTGFLDRPGPRWFTIPAHRPFADDLARGLYEALGPHGPEALSQALVLTPTRRGARALADAFVRATGGRAVLPPQMRPLGDLEAGEPPFEPGDLALDLPAAIDPLRRRFELTRLVAELWPTLPNRGEPTAAAALELGEALGGFLDSLQIEEVDAAERLGDLVEADLAEHWQLSRRFLQSALERWPERLADLGVVDVGARRVALLKRLAEAWWERPPQHAVIAAGSTGTAPATRGLLVAIAHAPQGCVVLPGLDAELAPEAWAEVDPQHPQGALKNLLDDAVTERESVSVWPVSKTEDLAGYARRRVINEALRPADQTKDWLQVIKELQEHQSENVVDLGLQGLSIVTADSEDEAATAAALLLREALETPDLTAALVTPDKLLSRRVTAKLVRWGIVPDSSAGEPLAGTPDGVLAALVARAAADPLSPVLLLAILKHPYVRVGGAALEVLERKVLRGPRRRSWEALREKAGEAVGARAVIDRLERVLGALPTNDSAPSNAARAVVEAMEALAAGHEALWSGPGGEAMSRLLAGLIREGEALPPATPRGFADLLDRLMVTETVRAGGATHPRLRILGAMEARLVRADRLILGGLEEDVWPAGAPLDPFLSRPMRETLGLPSPERRIGLSAHDFAQAACAPDVILLHSERRDGAPAVKSRWLWRLETLAAGARVEIPRRRDVIDWARALDTPEPTEHQFILRPDPRPPVEDRPNTLAVTRVEALTRDPYMVWARDILRLYELPRPDERVDVRIRGSAIHKAFERFGKDHPASLPSDAAAIFERLYLEALEAEGMPHEGLARETALAREAARWVVELETRRRADGRALYVERKGEKTFRFESGDFTLTAKADRIEVDPAGFGHVLDYKTGQAPSTKMVRFGFSPQLTLTAAILARGGFEGLAPSEPGELTYVRVTGRKPNPGVEEVRASPDGDGKDVLVSRDAVDNAVEGLERLVTAYRDPARAYVSRIAPQFVKLYPSDYDHLARVFEWSARGEDDE